MAADLTSPDYWETGIMRSAGRLFMLAALTDQPRHGYDIARAIREFCEGCCDPSDAMIYPGLRDLEAAGLITCQEEEQAGRKRKVCQLTTEGREALRLGAEAWARHLPAIGRVVAAAQGDVPLHEMTLEPACCPTCATTKGDDR